MAQRPNFKQAKDKSGVDDDGYDDRSKVIKSKGLVKAEKEHKEHNVPKKKK